MRRRFLLLLATLAGCQGSVPSKVEGDLAQPDPGEDLAVLLASDGGIEDGGVAADAASSGGGDLAHPRLGAQTLTFNLDAGAFPATRSHPNALVYIPGNFDPTPPLNLIVYIHGFDNCVTNIVRASDGTCSDGGVTRDAYSLAAQLEASGKNALLLAPEVAFEAATGDPGNLKYKDTFAALLQETLTDLQPLIGARTLADVGELIVASHSGGYTAADDVVDSTGITAREVWMLDSLYSSTVTTDFEGWVKQDLGSLRAPYRRFATFYTILDNACGGTDCNSETLAGDVRALYPGDAGVVIDEPSAAVTWTDDVYRHGFLCKHSSLAHNDIPRYYFVHLLSTSGLPNK
jgi:hypothetical protein